MKIFGRILVQNDTTISEGIKIKNTAKSTSLRRTPGFVCINIGCTREVWYLLSLGKNISDLMQRLSSEIISNPQESEKN